MLLKDIQFEKQAKNNHLVPQIVYTYYLSLAIQAIRPAFSMYAKIIYAQQIKHFVLFYFIGMCKNRGVDLKFNRKVADFQRKNDFSSWR